MINRTKLEHILEYAKQQKHICQHCKIPPGDMVEIVEIAMRKAGNSPVTPDGLSTVCAEAYQIVGVMADALGVFGDAAVQKVLDNLSQQKLVHRDVLPFSLSVTTDVNFNGDRKRAEGKGSHGYSGEK